MIKELSIQALAALVSPVKVLVTKTFPIQIPSVQALLPDETFLVQISIE